MGAVYDVTTCYRGPKEPSIVGVVNAESCSADLFVRRFPLTDIPTDSEEEMTEWLINLFKEKVCDAVVMVAQHLSFPYKRLGFLLH